MKPLAHHNTLIIKEIAQELGFDLCGVSKAQELNEDAVHLEKWLNKGYHGKMKWMENHFEKRIDPTKLVEDSKSVVSLLLNYYPYVIKDKLKTFVKLINERIGKVGGRVFVDSAPVLDRAWAAKSGLGWIGKNSMLITKQKGSFYFIAELILDIVLEPDMPTTDHCGTCTACIDACPTDAIVANKVIDSNKCISYLTIELQENIPAHFKGSMEGWVFGCDICQDVCPWNRFATPNNTPDFAANQKIKEFETEDWQELTEEIFKDVFKKSAVKRAGFIKLRKSLDFVKE
jgi:epoxyqueuosine reductase